MAKYNLGDLWLKRKNARSAYVT